MRLRVLITAAALLAIGCTTPEPVPVPQDIQQRVRDLLGDAPTFTGETCATLPADAPTRDNHRYRARADLPGDPDALLSDLRAKAIAAGWQPQRTDLVTLALVGPGGETDTIQLAAEPSASGLEVRALVEYRCTTTSPLFPTNSPPEPTESQQDSLAASFTATTGALRAVYGAFDQPVDTVIIPESDALPAERVRNCRTETAAGASWLIARLPQIPVRDAESAATALDSALPGTWSSTAGEPEKANGLTTVHHKLTGPNSLTITARVDTFPTGSTTLSFDSIRSACIPAA